ncbi:MAG TPA: glycosyltransferase family 9 protein [Caldimonas sp.]|nr:glycosyltransferase family 9 protein [Caldimonas sp.]HEX4232785.1 glycosyltransferase family 9 protein [Caldimonas sp.]
MSTGGQGLRADDRFGRILVVCTRQLGDVLLTTPLIRAARTRWPEATIDVLGFGGTLGMLRGNPDVGTLIEVPAGSGWLASLPLIRRLWRRYDLALIAQYSDRAHLYGFAAAKRRAGQVTDEAKSWWKRALLEHRVRMNDSQSHSVIEKLRLLAPWIEPRGAALVAPPPHALPAELAARLRPPYAVLQAPAAVAYKQWPIAHWRELIEALLARELQVVLTGATSALDRSVVDAVRIGLAADRVVDAAGTLDLPQMAALIEGAAVYIGGDTSITHLAAACDVPVIALYGPIDPRYFGPWPANETLDVPYVSHALVQRVGKVVVLQGTPPCVPCNRAGCHDRNDSVSVCLLTMGSARVVAEVDRILGRGGVAGRQ